MHPTTLWNLTRVLSSYLRTEATNLQRFAVPWLIATYGLSYAKSIEMPLLKEMLIAIIDENNMLGPGLSCAAQSKFYAIAFTDLTKKSKPPQVYVLSCSAVPLFAADAMMYLPQSGPCRLIVWRFGMP